jgi:hypothetical protein
MSVEKQQLQSIYDDIELCIENIKKDPSKANLADLQHAINKFFPDSRCVDLIYTPNIDKLFFGVYVFPIISGDEVVDILFHNTRYIVKRYNVELDSRMFTGQVMLTSGEITALLIHDISHLVNNSKPAETVKQELDEYLAKNNDVLKVSDSVHYRGILAYGFADAMRKYTTIFEEDHYTPNGITDEFIDWVDFTNLIRSAFNKLNQVWYNYNREVRNKFITFSWILRIYKDIKHNRIPALEAIKRCIELTPVSIEIEELKKLGERISRIDDDILLESKFSKDSENQLLKSLREEYTDQPRYKYRTLSIREAMEDDIDRLIDGSRTEYNNPNALPEFLHCMNKKMALIQDYVDTDESMTQPEFKQWDAMFQKLDRARKDIANSNLYSNEKRLINTYTRYGDQ